MPVRHLAAVAVAVVVAFAAPGASWGSDVDPADLPTSVVLQDARHDVQDAQYSGRGRMHPLDIYRVSGGLSKDEEVLILSMRVRDLRPGALDAIGEGDERYQDVDVVIGLRTSDGGSGSVSWDAVEGVPYVEFSDDALQSTYDPTCPEHDAATEGPVASQQADTDAEVVTFNLATECLPEGVTWARLDGYTEKRINDNTFSDDFFDTQRNRYVHSDRMRIAPLPAT